MKNKVPVAPASFRPAIVGIVFMTALSAFFCSSDPVVSGTSGSETGNGRVTGSIVDAAGNHRSHVEVMLLPSTYDPRKSDIPVLKDTTDTSGNYSFDCPPDNYTLQAVDLYDRLRAYSDRVHVDTNEIILPADTLKPPGFIKITLPENGHLQDGYFYLPGTTIYSIPDRSNGFAVLDSVPAAYISAVCYAEVNHDEVRIIRNDIRVSTDSSIDILYPEWRYTRTVYLNTSPSGVVISKNIADFPVLIRLSEQNFTFAQSALNGHDLFFANSGGKPLPFEIDYWNADEGIAHIWVKVDTVRADSGTQHILMFWGNSTMDTPSDSPAVFDTADGFQGVWHLNENLSTGMKDIGDRTCNDNSGTLVGNAISSVNGVIGRALSFGTMPATEEAYVKLPDNAALDYPEKITISCWVRLNENSPDSFNIIGKYSFCGDQSADCTISGYSIFCSSSRTIQLRVGFGTDRFVYLESDYRIADNDWHYIAGMFESGVMRLYIDDTRGSWNFTETPVPSPDGGFIGGKFFLDGTLPFAGEIDEVRISSTIRSSDWIRLNYYNQKFSNILVTWK